jgi:hypothetical protein
MPALIYGIHHIEEILPLFGKALVLREGITNIEAV